MAGFAEREQRYLWTDAFAVCNYVGLARATGEPRFFARAFELVDRVHHTLGRHREDDPRSGWISGLAEEEGEEHPTRGGLRIGKKLPERGPGELGSDRLEWDRDGQYFHYLTKWMHALDVLARAREEARLHAWSRELALAAYDGFVYTPPGAATPRMHWKMSVDLSRPVVASMGHHDPLDGLVTYTQIRETGRALDAVAEGGPRALDRAIASFAAMLARRDLTTDDPLGLGGLLMDAYRLDQLGARGDLEDAILAAARAGLESWAASGEIDLPASARLPFRELGLAIGLAAVDRIAAHRDAFERFQPLGRRIVDFWREPEHRRGDTWTDHRDINEVMLATALLPDACITLPVVAR